MNNQNKSYVIWNNKGGVGKSTITFHIATVYAEKNPNEDVLVIDMCPQANSSMILLGGGKKGEEGVQNLISMQKPKSVVGFITDSLEKNEIILKDYIIKCFDYNNNISENVYLLSGDGNLELVAPLLAQRANQPPISASDKPWEKIHLSIYNLTNNYTINSDRIMTVFIDTNPSFSIYTEMAILAGENLLVPINADDSSIYAITGLFNLIWGSVNKHPVYGKYTFSSIVDNNNMRRPKIHLLLGNRFTQKKGSAHAFKALSSEATKKMYGEFKNDPTRFRGCKNNINTQEDFESEFTIELRDFNSAGVIAANQGIPLSKLEKHTYKVYGEDIQVAKEQREKCKETIDELVNKL